MIYEMRVYHAVPGKLLARFEKHTLKIWQRFGIRQAGFFTTVVGETNQQLIYFLAWESLADREKKWDAFLVDPEWLQVRGETERDGPIVARVVNQLLAPTAFSAVK